MENRFPLSGPRDPVWERGFTRDELACFERRGGRLSQSDWLALFRRDRAVAAFYERMTGLPFCREDRQALDRALSMTSLSDLLRAIERAMAWPPESPGFHLIKSGFIVVNNLILNDALPS